MRVTSAAEVFAGLDPGRLVEALRHGLAHGGVFPPRVHLTVDDPGHRDATLLLMPGWRTNGAMGVKVATVFPGNSVRGLPTVMAQYLLMSAQTGSPRAVIDGTALTLTRTAATSALAADLMAARGASVLAMIGTGALAPHMVRAHCAMRKISGVRICGRSAERAERLAKILRFEGIEAVAITAIEDAVRDADIVSCATTAHAPIIRAAMLKPGCHVDLVGSFAPDMCEADGDVVAQSSIVVDDMAAVEQCGDLAGPFAAKLIDRCQIMTLADLIRTPTMEYFGKAFTLFKSIGTAHADLIAAEALIATLDGGTDDGRSN